MDFEKDLGGGRPLQSSEGPPGSTPPRFDPVRLELGAPGEDGVELVFRKYRARVERFFAKRGFPAADLPDLTQETFLRVFRAEADFDSRGQLEGWLFEIAKNVARNAWRDKNALKRDALEVSLDEPGADGVTPRAAANPALQDNASDALTVILSQEQRTSLREAMEELPEQMRHCIRFRVISDLKYRQIAVIMKISIETVKSHLHQATKRLRERLGPIDV